MFAKFQHRLDPQAVIPPLKFIFVPSVQSLSFQSVTHSSTQRAQPIPFAFNRFRTLPIATGGVGGYSSKTLPPRAHLLFAAPYPLSFPALAHSFAVFFSQKKLHSFLFNFFATLCAKQLFVGVGCPF